jgi:predicted chitinase
VNLGGYVYADRNVNGNEAGQEGYTYRGRGIIQLTGKSNYAKYTRIHNGKDPSGLRDSVVNPDFIVGDVSYGIESAFVCWGMNNMNAVIANSDAIRTESNISQHVADISTEVNGGVIGLAERVTLFNDLRSMIEMELN